MKRKFNRIAVVMMLMLVVALTACGSNSGSSSTDTGGNTVTTKEEVRAITEEFYDVLYDADNFTMSSYYDDELITVFTKDQDKMYENQVSAGYDYYMFMEDGKKYVITDDRSLFEDESTYDLAAETIEMLLDMNVLGYFDIDDDSFSYSATKNGEDELVTTIQASSDDTDVEMTVTGKKEDGNITEIISEIKYGEETMVSKYEFAYDQHIDLPEYTEPKTYDDLPHVDSPYKTFGEIIDQLGEDDMLNYMFDDDELIVLGSKDGRYYQFSSSVDDEFQNAYENFDFLDENYEQMIYELISDIEIEDCIDYTDVLVPQAELDAYVGKNINALLADGFEVSGYSFWEGTNLVFVDKDSMGYKADVEVPDGFDTEGEFDYEDLNDFVIKSISFDSPQYNILPMK